MDHHRHYLAQTVTRQALIHLRAARTGDLQGLMDVLSPDVVQISDGGGRIRAARFPVHGRERVATFSIHVVRRAPRGRAGEPDEVQRHADSGLVVGSVG